MSRLVVGETCEYLSDSPIVEFTPTNEPELTPDPSLHYSEDQPADAAKKEIGNSGDDQDSGSDTPDR